MEAETMLNSAGYMREREIEAELIAKAKTAPRLTPDMVDATIVGEYYHRVPDTTLTLCVLTLRNGFHVVGESASASPENYDEAIGRKLSRERARDKIWALEGYRLREQLSDAKATVAAIMAHRLADAEALSSRPVMR